MEWVDILPNQTSKRSWRADKLSQIGSSIFAEVSEWKQEAFQAGRHIIDLSISGPDRGPSEDIREVLSQEALKADNYTYPGTRGTMEFREQSAAWMQRSIWRKS